MGEHCYCFQYIMTILSKLLINYPIDGQEILDTTFFKVQEMALGNLMHKVHHLITDFLCNMFYLFIDVSHTLRKVQEP